MANLVRNDVGFREVALSTEALGEFVVKRQVDVHAFIDRAIERACLCFAGSATRVGRAGEQYELGVAISLPVLGEQFLPSGLCVVEHESDEVARRVGAFGTNLGASHGSGRATHEITDETVAEYEDDNHPAKAEAQQQR